MNAELDKGKERGIYKNSPRKIEIDRLARACESEKPRKVPGQVKGQKRSRIQLPEEPAIADPHPSQRILPLINLPPQI